MLKSTRVRDLMAADVITLDANEPVGVALERLRARRMGGAPVISDGHVVGVVSRTDLTDIRHDTDGDRLTVVKEVMTHVLYAVQPDDPAIHAARLMAQENVHRVVVVSPDGRLVGIVTSMDVVRAVSAGQSLTLPDADVPVEFVRLAPRQG